MELDTTTFTLELVNFGVLLWLLWRFLYRPLRAALEQRAAAAAAVQALADRGTALDARAAELAAQETGQANRRAAAEAAMQTELETERHRRLAALEQELRGERDRGLARLQQELQAERQHSDAAARERASTFVAQYLRSLASPVAEGLVIERFLSELDTQADAARLALADEAAGSRVEIATAHPVAPAMRGTVEQALRAVMPADGRTFDWREDPTLLAGIQVHLPGHQLEASLRRGLDAFAGRSSASVAEGPTHEG